MTVSSGKPETPYAGTSGWSGTDTSEARVRRDDADGTTAMNQATALALARRNQGQGITVGELAATVGVHHGKASAALSVLHKTGVLARLRDTRAGAKIYVDPEFIHNRETEDQGRPNAAAAELQERLDRIKAEAERWLDGVHNHYAGACRHCAAETIIRMIER